MLKNTDAAVKPQRSYQLDVLKLLLAIMVFICHTRGFVEDTTPVFTSGNLLALGDMAVGCFFVISGMLMTNSCMKKAEQDGAPGTSAFGFVLNKFKGIAVQYWVAFVLGLGAYALVMGTELTLRRLPRIVPEFFALHQTGLSLWTINAPMWYLSAMFIAMLPLSYLLIKHSDMFLYVIAPLVSVFGIGYCYTHTINDYQFGFVSKEWTYTFTYLCMGAVAWLIYSKIKQFFARKVRVSHRVLLTVAELLLVLLIFGIAFAAMFKTKKAVEFKSLFSVTMLFPVLAAIILSGESYVSRLFRCQGLQYAGSLSLALYLTHGTARVASSVLSTTGYGCNTFIMLGFTAMFCFIYYTLVMVIKGVLGYTRSRRSSNNTSA